MWRKSFLAQLSWRLTWAIVIAHRLSSVHPSSSVRPKTFHIFNFFSRTAWWILMKLGRNEVLVVPYKCCCFSARSAQGHIQGGAKIGHRGSSPSSRNFFFRLEGYSDQPIFAPPWIHPCADLVKRQQHLKGTISTSSLPSFIRIHQAVLEKKLKMWKSTDDDGRWTVHHDNSSLQPSAQVS